MSQSLEDLVTDKAAAGASLLLHLFHRLLEQYQVAENIRSSCGSFPACNHHGEVMNYIARIQGNVWRGYNCLDI